MSSLKTSLLKIGAQNFLRLNTVSWMSVCGRERNKISQQLIEEKLFKKTQLLSIEWFQAGCSYKIKLDNFYDNMPEY